jgi:hypothetical protein
VQRGASWSGRGTQGARAREEKVDYKPMMQRPALAQPKVAGRTRHRDRVLQTTSLHRECKVAYQQPVQNMTTASDICRACMLPFIRQTNPRQSLRIRFMHNTASSVDPFFTKTNICSSTQFWCYLEISTSLSITCEAKHGIYCDKDLT